MIADNSLRDRLVRVSDLETIRGAAAFVQVSPMTVKAWVDGGILPSIRLGNCTVVYMPDVTKVYATMLSRRENLEAV